MAGTGTGVACRARPDSLLDIGPGKGYPGGGGGVMSGGRAVLILAFLGGCGLPEADFRDARNEAHCEALVRCYPAVYASIEECVGDWGEAPPAPTCTYDEVAGKACVSELAELECPAEGEIPVLPAACGAVYTDCVTGE